MEIKLVKMIGRLGVRTNVVLGVIVSAGYVLQGVLLSFALTQIYEGGDTVKAIWWIAAAAIAVAVRCVLVWAAVVAAQRTACNVRRQLRERLLQKLFDLDLSWHCRKVMRPSVASAPCWSSRIVFLLFGPRIAFS